MENVLSKSTSMFHTAINSFICHIFINVKKCLFILFYLRFCIWLTLDINMFIQQRLTLSELLFLFILY